MSDIEGESVDAIGAGLVFDLCVEAAESNNPLPLFRALLWLLTEAQDAAIREAVARPGDRDAAIREAMSGDQYVRLPVTLHTYLRRVMWMVCELAAGRDFRDYPDGSAIDFDRKGPAHEAALNAWRDYRQRAAYGGEPIDHEKAARLVPLAFGFTRQGFNAFKDAERRGWIDRVRAEERAAIAAGLPPLDARFEAMEALGYRDERSFRRAKSGKKRVRGKPPR